jgi:hypothetical protein
MSSYYDPTQPGLPVFEMVIDANETSDVEVAAIALVDKPAIEKNFMAFSKSVPLHFDINQEQRIISGPAMISNSLIYRRDESGEYNVFFSKETVKQIALKFFKKDYHKNLNLFHDPSMSLEGVTIFESFMTDETRGIMPMKGFEDLPDGTWFISAKIENDEVWGKIKSGEVKGFSVEGLFSYRKNGLNPQKHGNEEKGLMSELKELIKDIKQKFFTPGVINPPESPVQSMGTVQLKDGTEVSATALEVGGVLTIGEAPAPPGEYELMDGTKLTVGEGGVISAVGTAQEAPVPTNDYSAQFDEINQKFTSYEEKFTAYEQRFAKAEEALSNANATIVKLITLVEKMADTPTADPTDTKNNFQSQVVATKEERRKDFATLLSKLKKN